MTAAPADSLGASDPAPVPPDLSAYRAGNAGIPYAFTFDSGRAGPHALVVAIVHGNEISGAIALDRLLRADVRPARGRLSLAFANVAAYETFDPTRPGDARFLDEDLNRVWSPDRLDGDARTVERRRARELRPLVDQADFLLDLHSMQRGDIPILLSGPSEKGRRFAGTLCKSAVIVADAGHPNGRRLRDYGTFNDPANPRNAVLAECGAHFAAATARFADAVTTAFLGAAGVLDAGADVLAAPEPTPPRRWVEVTHRFVPQTDAAHFVDEFHELEVVPQAGTTIARDGPREIRTPYDDCVLVMPSRRLARGQTAVRLGRYVVDGMRDGG